LVAVVVVVGRALVIIERGEKASDKTNNPLEPTLIGFDSIALV